MSVHDTTVDIQNPPVIPVEVVFGTIYYFSGLLMFDGPGGFKSTYSFAGIWICRGLDRPGKAMNQ